MTRTTFGSLPTLTLLAALAMSPAAMAGGPRVSIGLAGGVLSADNRSPLGTAFEVAPRLGLFFGERALLEFDPGIALGGGRCEDGSFFSFSPRLDLGALLLVDEPVQPYLLMGVGAYVYQGDEALATRKFEEKGLGTLVDFGVGARVPIGAIALRTDVRVAPYHASDRDTPRSFAHAEWLLGIDLVLGSDDADKDGVKDKDDGCPAVPEDIDSYNDFDGCPDEDNDGDGILDGQDGCRDQAEDKDDFEDTDGCLDADNDKDGILDGEDACPVVAGVASGKGCPDADGDGIVDEKDACPSEAGTVALGGCPDKDGDGIADAEDECPDVAGAKRSFGCPDGDDDRVPDFRDKCPTEKADERAVAKLSDGCPSRVFVTESAIVILEKVYFQSGKDVIKKESFGLLDDVAKVFETNPSIKKVEVAGHTDTDGDETKNLDLSERRAKAVVAYLVKKGIAEDRLVAKGYGETVAIDTNDTDEGKANNRRVEFTILEQEQKKVLKPLAPR